MVGGGLAKMVSTKKAPRKVQRTPPKVTSDDIDTTFITKNITKTTKTKSLEDRLKEAEGEVKVPVKTSKEPVHLLSGEASLRKLLDEAPEAPLVLSTEQMVTWVDKYNRWKARVKGSKR